MHKRWMLTGLILAAGAAIAMAGPMENARQAFQQGDNARGVAELRKAAEAGDANAQLSLGNWFAFGQGAAKDPVEAAQWFRMAADRGLPAAQNALGGLYFNGQGVSRNLSEAAKWFRKAAMQGFSPAQNALGAMYAKGLGVDPSPIQAYMWFSVAAARGHANAKTALSDLARNLPAPQREEGERLAKNWKPVTP
ncbi:MAG: sel1 repeat family protein [Magnetococcales bacterium]|nr:sel1 repeat family protein [Magnetococcales bacterium]